MLCNTETSYLSVYVEGARLLVQVYVGDPGDFAGLLNVGPVGPDGQTHEVVPNGKLFMKPRRQLPGILQNNNNNGGGEVRPDGRTSNKQGSYTF